MFYSQLEKLCKQQNISVTAFAIKKLKMSGSNVTKWKNGNVPKSDTVQKIASYFNVSTDYLLGNTDIKREPSGEDLKQTEKFAELLEENGVSLSDCNIRLLADLTAANYKVIEKHKGK